MAWLLQGSHPSTATTASLGQGSHLGHCRAVTVHLFRLGSHPWPLWPHSGWAVTHSHCSLTQAGQSPMAIAGQSLCIYSGWTVTHSHCGLTQAGQSPMATVASLRPGSHPQPLWPHSGRALTHGHCGLTQAGQSPTAIVASFMPGSHPWPLWPYAGWAVTHGH